MKKEIADVIDIIRYSVIDSGYELIDFEYSLGGKRPFLRVYIDRAGGIQLKDCQEISRRISEIVERKNLIKENYQLEVSSPGVDRPLKTERDFYRNAGREVTVKYKTADGSSELTGTIGAATPVLKLKLPDASEVDLPYDSIIQGKIKLKW